MWGKALVTCPGTCRTVVGGGWRGASQAVGVAATRRAQLLLKLLTIVSAVTPANLHGWSIVVGTGSLTAALATDPAAGIRS